MSPKPQQDLPPYNPWQSCLVEASAGSGKTWQLSRRFLALVVAGADPSTILTVTFTKKAAAEMRERIVKDAIALGRGADEFKDFIKDIALWLPSGDETMDRPQIKIRDAREASRLIIQKTQTLKITTIDALFIQWSQRFPLETAVTINDLALKSPWDLISTLAQKQLNNDAWGDVLAMAADHNANRDLMTSISANAPNGKIKSLANAIDPLTKSDTFLWYIQMLGSDEPLKLFTVPDHIDSDEEFLVTHHLLLEHVIKLASNKVKVAESLNHLSAKNLQGLIDQKIVTGNCEKLHGGTFRTANKNNEKMYVSLNQELERWSTHKKLAALNQTASLVWTLYNARTGAAHKRKVEGAVGSFSDAAKGASVLACDERMVGGRAMAWSTVRHLMLDEFQDTSRLQWLIFEKIALELLAGQMIDAEAGPRPSVFIVGDKKQSIYRFREAAPEVLDLARENLESHGLVCLGMNTSYRSSSMILDLVNLVFEDGQNIVDFPEHKPAPHLLKSQSVKSQYGTVCVYKAAEAHTDADGVLVTGPQAEAAIVARHIRSCLDGMIPLRIFDSQMNGWRAPRCSDFVILYPTSTHSQGFEDAMRELAIPSRREETKGFFGRQEIQDLNALVTWLTWPADTLALCTVLKSPIIGLMDHEVQALLLDGVDEIFQMEPSVELNDSRANGLKSRFPAQYELLRDLRASHHNESLSGLIGRLLTTYGIADRYERAFGPMEGPLAKANVLKWFDLVRGSSSDEALAAHSWSLALDEASEENETGNASLASNAVTLMSIHKSKGLEFPCVIMTGSASDWHKAETGWIKDTRPGHEGLWYVGTKKLRPQNSTELKELLDLSEQDSRGEKARLLYVALTRASHHLVVTGFSKKQSAESEPSSSYLDLVATASERLEAVTQTLVGDDGRMFTRGDHPLISDAHLESPVPDYARHNVQPLGLQPVKILTPSGPSKNRTTGAQSTLEPSLMEPSRPASINQFVKHFQQRVPEGAGKAFGTLVHKLLENHVQQVTWSDERLARFLQKHVSEIPTLKGSVSDSANDLKEDTVQGTLKLSSNELHQLVDLAKADVTALLASDPWRELLGSAQSVQAEVPMAMIANGNMVNAKADLIIFRDGGQVDVVDYKTIPIGHADAVTFCSEHGYTAQLQDYCNIVHKSLLNRSTGNKQDGATVTGYVLFTNPVRIVQVAKMT